MGKRAKRERERGKDLIWEGENRWEVGKLDRDKSERRAREREDRKEERKEKRGRGKNIKGKGAQFRVSQEGDEKRETKLGTKRKEEIKGRKLMFWNIVEVYNKDTKFWKFIREHDYISLNETWLEEEGWKLIKNRLLKSHEWDCSFATKEKRKGKAKRRFIVGKRKGWGKTSKLINMAEDLVVTEIEEREKTLVIISIYNRKEWKNTEERINRMVEDKVLNNIIIEGDFNIRTELEGIEIEEGGKERKSKDKKNR